MEDTVSTCNEDLLALLSRAIEACRSSAGTEERENFIRDARAAIAKAKATS